jgi:hypothetical protein
MRRLLCAVMLAPAVMFAPAAGAHPGAAPWAADGRPGRQSCATCHFEAAPVKGSASLSLAGLPAKVEPGHVYELTLTLKHAGMKVAGFLVSAMGGTFTGGEGVEVEGAAARSTLVRAKQADAATWRFSWRAPADALREAAFFVSANAGNDDQSPLGDIIYMDVVTAK